MKGISNKSQAGCCLVIEYFFKTILHTKINAIPLQKAG